MEAKDRLLDESCMEATRQLFGPDIVKRSRAYEISSRVRDVLLSAIGLIVLSPVMLIVALAIVIDNPGASPIFVQKRVGKDGVIFRFYKFRSMIPKAEQKLKELLVHNEMDGPAFKMKKDPRITRVGRIIRKTSLDELPQLMNVLKGDMAIVGPRPALPREVKKYDDYQRQRLLVKPGLTCYWQTMPNRYRLSFEEWMEMDYKYIRERSFITDMKVIFRTAAEVFGMNGE